MVSYGNDGVFLTMGNAGFVSSTVCQRLQNHLFKQAAYTCKLWRGPFYGLRCIPKHDGVSESLRTPTPCIPKFYWEDQEA